MLQTLWKNKKKKKNNENLFRMAYNVQMNGFFVTFPFVLSNFSQHHLNLFGREKKTLNLFQISAIITVIVFILLPRRIDQKKNRETKQSTGTLAFVWNKRTVIALIECAGEKKLVYFFSFRSLIGCSDIDFTQRFWPYFSLVPAIFSAVYDFGCISPDRFG